MPADAFKDALVNGKAVLINNVWWQIASRDLASNRIVLVVSKYAMADGGEQEKPKAMSFDALIQKIKSGQYGANIGGKRYGPDQDPAARDKVRKAAGLSAAPGSAKLRAGEDDEKKK